jgi:hypothetical protein
MAILLGLGLALVLLYFWLIGNWFARVLMLPVCAALLGIGFALIMVSGGHPGPNNGTFGLLVGLALAWPVSSIPIYYYRWQANKVTLLRLDVPFS